MTTAGSSKGCIFCDHLAAGDDRGAHILHRGEQVFVILNAFPYNNGHLMIAPYEHVGALEALPDGTVLELMQLTQRAMRALTDVYGPEGVNVGINLGRPAGAGILDHVHIHLVPRWNGDTNFMSVVGNTRVLPEAMDETAGRLRPIFERLLRSRS